MKSNVLASTRKAKITFFVMVVAKEKWPTKRKMQIIDLETKDGVYIVAAKTSL